MVLCRLRSVFTSPDSDMLFYATAAIPDQTVFLLAITVKVGRHSVPECIMYMVDTFALQHLPGN